MDCQVGLRRGNKSVERRAGIRRKVRQEKDVQVMSVSIVAKCCEGRS